ncbi:MAG: hypothetical protein CME31_10500 [Gimesia sp.]|uniref:Uncharacterized protein n=1 Tax=Gimesia maris TaxID=122 RepID=A0A3D3R0P9_9PLAN|nr:hypothetical protein [Gimesia sp.]HCO22421.1 hypothetical protein [Gimesia maris]|tara:strand:- start:19395 stop:21137 length:1743 start_codon:yes stop_codon:yes gene_type:complete
MSSIFYATTKQFCKRAWFGAVLAVGALVMGPLLIVLFLKFNGLQPGQMEQSYFDFHFAYLGVSWVFFLGVCLHAFSGSEKYCLGLPVSSASIATWLMLAMAGFVVVLQLLTNGLYRLLFFDEHWLTNYWPLLGPLLFMVTLILVGHCLFWSVHAPSFTKTFLGGALMFGMLAWFVSRYYPNGFKSDIVPWNCVTLGEFVTMQLTCLAAWYQGTRAFAEVRAGTAVPSPAWERMKVWWNALLTGAIPEQSAVPFSPRSSLVRLHWRDSCQQSVIVGGGVFGLLSLMFNLLIGTRLNSEPTALRDVLEGFVAMSTILTLAAAVTAGAILGLGICSTGRTEMKRCLAMAPLTDSDFNATLFANMVKVLVWSILIVQSALLLSLIFTAVLYGADTLSVLQVTGFLGNGSNSLSDMLLYLFGENGFLCHTLVTLIGFWIIAANIVSVLWTGRTWFIVSAIGVCFGGLFFYSMMISLLEAFFPRQYLAELVIISMLLILYFLILGGTLVAYLTARRRQLISKTRFLGAGLLWSFAVMGVLVTLLSMAPHYPFRTMCGEFCVFSALGALILAPFATIPLALSWNRHR